MREYRRGIILSLCPIKKCPPSRQSEMQPPRRRDAEKYAKKKIQDQFFSLHFPRLRLYFAAALGDAVTAPRAIRNQKFQTIVPVA